MSQLFTELMKDEQIKRAVLVQFGFGDVNKSKVKKWVKDQFPVEYAEIKSKIPSKKVIQFQPNETEMTTREERDAILDNAMEKEDSMNESRVGLVHLNVLRDYINQKECLDAEYEGLQELIYDFIEENGLSKKFYDFLDKNKYNYSLDVPFMMLDYKD